ncbi:MAG: LPS biosynthesis protein [Roseiflexaceae bacterium]
MDLISFGRLLQRWWWVMLVPAVVASGVSLIGVLGEPPQYRASARLLITLADPARVDIEDALAYDLAAIAKGRPLAVDVSERLNNAGQTITPDQVRSALSATNLKREVTLHAVSGDPQQALLIRDAAIAQLREQGLAYWGVGAPVPERPGLAVVELDVPAEVVQVNGLATKLGSIGLRGVAGLVCGLVITLAMAIVGRKREE